MTISINQFLQAEDFDLAENIVFSPFNPQDLQNFSDIIISTIEFTQSEALDGLTESSSKADQSDSLFTPSFQPLNEAGILTAGDTLDKSVIGATTNNSLGIQNSSIEFLNNTSRFNTETDSNLTEEAINQIEEAQKTISTGTLGLANSLDLAEGGLKFSTTNMSFGATNILMGTDGTYHLAAPIISTVASIENKQAGTIQQTADLITDNAKSKVVQVEGLNSSIAANTMTTSLEGQINVSNYNTNTSVQKIVNTSNVVQNIGNELVQNRSRGVIANQADGSISTQAADISITASAGSMSAIGNGIKSLNPLENNASFQDIGNGLTNITAVDPTGVTTTFRNVNQSNNFTPTPKWQEVGGLQGRDEQSIAPTQANKGNGNITIISNKGTTSIINNNMVMSSEGSSNQTVGGNLIQNAKGSATISGNFTNIEAQVGTTVQSSGYIRQQAGRTGTFISNGFTFAGFRFPSIRKFIDQIQNNPLKIRQIPNLPSLPPGISYEDLENCIPDKFRNPPNGPDINGPTETPDENNAPSIEEAGRREKQIPIPTGKEGGFITEEDGITAATDGIKTNRNDSNTILSTNTSPTDQTNISTPNKLLGAAIVVKGGPDIFPKDIIEGEDIYNRQETTIIDPDSDEELNGPNFIRQAINNINQQSIEDTVSNLLLDTTWIPRLIPLLTSIKLYIEEQLLNETNLLTNIQTEEINLLLRDIDGSRILGELRDSVVERASVGGVLSFLSSAYSRVKSNIGLVNDIVEDSNDLNTFNILRNTVTATESITDREIFSNIENVINSSTTLSSLYGQINSVITNPNSNISSVVDNINFQDIENVISLGLERIGVNNIQITTSIARVLNNIKNSEDYKQQGLTTEVVSNIINQISLETGLSNREAIRIYDDSRDIIASILEGNIRDALLSSELTSILGFFVGESNAALLEDLQELYLNGRSTINLVQDTFARGQNIYNTVNNIYSQLKAVPALIGLMNNYEMPTLSQLNTIFKCFELMKQVNKIIDDVQDISENIGSFTQAGRDIEELFTSFNNLLSQDNNETKTNTPYEVISQGTASGSIVGTITNSINDLNIDRVNNENNIDISNRLNDIVSINDSSSNTTNTGSSNNSVPGQINSTIVNNNPSIFTNEDCINSILDARVDIGHSNNPNQWRPKRNNLDAVDILEKLPRLGQIFNSIIETPSSAQGINNFINLEQLNDLKNTQIIPTTTNCFLAPKLNLLESSIEVIDIKNNILLYKMLSSQTLRLNNKDVFPTTNTIVQLYIERFFDTTSGSELSVQRNENFFSPILYNFKTISYHRQRDIGVAHLLPNPTRIHLKNTNNVTYNYSITDIGNRLDPDILDAYIIA